MALYTLDVKDAFLLMDQPEDEKAMIVTENGTYRLKRSLPGQRNAAAQWFKGFCKVAKEFGLVQDVMQPTMMKKPDGPNEMNENGKLYLTIHVDDLLLIGHEAEVEKFIKYMDTKGWKTEKRGPLYSGSFNYLKREMELIDRGITIRPDKQHIKELARLTKVDSSAARSLAGRVGVGRTRHIAAGLLWLQQKVGSKELRITGIPTAVNTSDIGTKVLSKARMSGLKYLIKMINGDDEKIGYAEYQEIKMKEDLKKNTGKLAKTLGANARVAVVIALSLLQGGQGADTQELETEENEGTDTWWVRLLITMICLASVGALSLARMTLQAVQTWCSRRRGHRQPVQRREEEEDADDPHVRRGVQESTDQQEEPRYENDPEKVNMQWQIVHLEVAVAEQEERLKEAREERDRQAREVVRMYNMCSELRFELEAVKEEKDKAQKKAIQVAGTDDERAQEMERMAEDVARAWEMVELWKKRVTECQRQGQDELRSRLQEAKFTLDRKIWNIGKTSVCYHQPGCGHLVNSTVKTLKPCAHCVPEAMGTVLNFPENPVQSMSSGTQ